MNSLIDTHTHLERFHRNGILDKALEAAATAGVDRMVAVGTDLDDWDLYAKLAEEHPGRIDYTVGVHPCSVEAGWEAAVDRIAAYWERGNRPVALGEIGLDRFHLPKEREAAQAIFEQQQAAFAFQLELAKRLETPVVIHSRGAFGECLEMIDASGVDWNRVVFHCFSEGPGEMQQLMDRGGYGSFTGVITFKNAESVRDAAKLQGLDRLMIETDAPYLSPMPHRGKPNEPAYLRHTADFCAALFGMDGEAFAAKTSENARAFYGLK